MPVSSVGAPWRGGGEAGCCVTRPWPGPGWCRTVVMSDDTTVDTGHCASTATNSSPHRLAAGCLPGRRCSEMGLHL